MDPVLPPELGAVLRATGYRAAGPLGLGGTGPRWSAVDADGVRWGVALVPAAAVARLHDRVALLAAVDHAGVARVGPVLPVPGGRAVALTEAVTGIDLAALTAGRGRLGAPEVAGVVSAVASALACLHRSGVVHGDVSPANVVVAERGPVLVDVLLGAWSAEGGTRGFASASRRLAPSPADDVHALGRVGLALLGPAREADAQDGVHAKVDALCRAASSDDVAARPGADALAATAASIPAQAVRMPAPDVLAQVALRSVAAARPATTRPSRGRHRRPRRRLVPLLALALGAVTASGAVALVLGPAGATVAARSAAGTVDAGSGGGASASADAAGWRARDLTLRRAVALAAGDGVALRSVTVPGSPAALADLRLLAAGAARVAPGSGLRVQVVQRGPARPTGRQVSVLVASRTVQDGRGGPWRGVELVVDRASGRVVRVEAG